MARVRVGSIVFLLQLFRIHLSQTTNEEDATLITSAPFPTPAGDARNVTTSSCPIWVEYLDKTSFALSNFLVLPFLIWLLRRSCLIVLQTVPPNFNADELKEKLLAKVYDKWQIAMAIGPNRRFCCLGRFHWLDDVGLLVEAF